MFLADGWKDYAVLDAGDGEKLERWGEQWLIRPDPQVIWPKSAPELWPRAQARYARSQSGGGAWEFRQKIPESWRIAYGELCFLVRPTGFKHTGLFPEQAANWEWMAGLIRGANRPIRVLNLFAYTGGATLAALCAGADVTHLDAAKGMVAWAKENAALSGLAQRPARFLVDDALKFVLREQRRGSVYDAILMDPPSYGRGPDGQVWKLENEIFGLLLECTKLLSERPLFFLLNAYTTGLQPAVLQNLVEKTVGARLGGQVRADELGLPVQSGGVLPCGASGRWRA
ncbi:MAG: class I SAM-dependent methyltransferase [Christensenellaceae bacterium]|jgi:23S rRNA (cytosine1962-C5)-methyltransferase|nr:class I SAM-dependent methyltransferase [Christensenellaceae bacterium]